MTTGEKARAYAEKETEDFVSEHYGSMKKSSAYMTLRQKN